MIFSLIILSDITSPEIFDKILDNVTHGCIQHIAMLRLGALLRILPLPKKSVATDAQALPFDMAVGHSAIQLESEVLSCEKATPLGESGIGDQQICSPNDTSCRVAQLEGEEFCEQRSYTIEDCYQALLRYRSSRIGDHGTESLPIERSGGYAPATLKATLVEDNQEVGKTPEA